MNNALKTTIGDLTRSLQKNLDVIGFSKHLGDASVKTANQIAERNRVNHPDLERTVKQTGPLSFEISFSAPGLWSNVFGTATRDGTGFDTQDENDMRRMP